MHRQASALRPSSGRLLHCFRTVPVARRTIRSGLRVLGALRTAKLEDLPELEMIAEEANSNWAEGDLEAEMSLQQSTFLVSEGSGGIQGMAIGWHLGGELQILLVAVAMDSRRKGVGRALITELLDRAERREGDVAVLEVRVSNAAAIGLYRSLGFESLGTRRAYYQDGEDALLFVKDLVPRKAACGASTFS